MGGLRPGGEGVAVHPEVVADTGVFSALLEGVRNELSDRYQGLVAGSLLYIATQTLAELRFGAFLRGWGPTRIEAFEKSAARAVVLPVDDRLVWGLARLRVDCRRVGHPLHQPIHGGDLWIAASAMVNGLPLVSDDRVFVGVPGLELVTRSR
ncbi:MAG: PIN domain-containing protein [Acidimicrobiales bacterium]